jgi:uncharacterized protein with GYD domain
VLSHKPKLIDPSWSLEKRIWWALEAISDRCDGAVKLDGAGYSKYDRPIADRLQGLHLSQWAAKDVDEGLHLIRKYRKQLESMGVSIDDIIGDMGMIVTMDDSNDTMDIANRINSGRTVPISTEELVEQIEEVKHPVTNRVNVALEDDSNSSGSEVYCELLIGAAGCGKTFEIRRRIAEDPNYAILTATTGIAAINLGTITLNSTLGYFNTESLEESMIKGYLEKRLRDIIDSGYKNLVCDETSMMEFRQLDMIYEGIRRVNERSSWHDKGKLGLILVSDFCQLPPIPAKGVKDIPWAFKADCWDKFEANTTRLTKYWRQTDERFLEAINLIRGGNGRDGSRILRDMGVTFSMESDKAFDGTTIIAKNDAVDGFNFIAHSRVNGQMIKVKNSRWGKLRKEWDHIPAELSLKVGAYVMILNNDTPDFTYVNGDCGHVRNFDPDHMDEGGDHFTIQLIRNNAEVAIGQITRFNYQKDAPRELGEDNRALRSAYRYDPDSDDLPLSPAFDVKAKRWIVGSLTYYPLRLAYATTVHKSQSLSLDRVQMDVNNHMMKMPGMTYVALSRCRTPEGLRVIGTPERLAEVVTVSPEVLKYL